MHVPGNAPSLMHAEMHTQYLPWPEDPHIAAARQIAEVVARGDSQDDNVTALARHTLALVDSYARAPEPAEWSAPQRCVWRFSHLPFERRLNVVNDSTISNNAKAFAVVNSGRWIVNCPFQGCNSSQYASFRDHRFFCVDCGSKAVLQQWVEVVWPEDHLKVEAWLGNRPVDARNWEPGETGEDIAIQDAYALTRGIPTEPQDQSKWPKPFTMPDGTDAPILHSETREWAKLQKAGR